MPCCRSLVMKHSNLTSAADTRLSMVALVRGGRGVWRTKQGTVLHFNMRRRQWQVGLYLNVRMFSEHNIRRRRNSVDPFHSR